MSFSKINGIVNKIYDYDPGYKWLLVEVVKEIKSSKEFASLSGTKSWYQFYFDMERLENGDMTIDQIKYPFIEMVCGVI